jgi:DNA repair protein RecO (recombination protein O)
MKQIATTGIVLSRTNYGEADRIITILTQGNGKIRLVAKGVRKIKSKLAGGIELFSVNDIIYLPGKGGLGTLVSSRLRTNYGSIVGQIDRTLYAYEVLKMVHRITEDSPEPEYFIVLQHMLNALNTIPIPIDCIKVWFHMRLLMLGGHSPNLSTDSEGVSLDPSQHYMFSFDDMSFMRHNTGHFTKHHITYLRLASSLETPKKLFQVQVPADILASLVQLTRTMLDRYSYVN